MNTYTQDISTLTTIPESAVKRLVKISSEYITHCIVESVLDKKETCEIDIGIGSLMVDINTEELKFKFIPSKTLQNNIYESIIDKNSKLALDVEDNLRDKIIYAYKNLI